MVLKEYSHKKLCSTLIAKVEEDIDFELLETKLYYANSKINHWLINGVRVNIPLAVVDSYFIFKIVDCDTIRLELHSDNRVLDTSIEISIDRKMIELSSHSDYIELKVLDRPKSFGVNPKVAKGYFPLWKVIFEESLYGKDGGNSYDDPYNDVRRSGSIKYFIRKSLDKDWELYFEDSMGDFSYATHKAVITLSKLRETYDLFTDRKWDEISMFEWGNHMFKLTHHIESQKCVCGEAIGDTYYNDYENDRSIKIDYLESHVFLYEKDTLVIAHGKLYLNGELVMTKEELEEKHGIKYYQAENMYPNEARNKLVDLFPTAKYYKSWGASGGMRKEGVSTAEEIQQARELLSIPCGEGSDCEECSTDIDIVDLSEDADFDK